MRSQYGIEVYVKRIKTASLDLPPETVPYSLSRRFQSLDIAVWIAALATEVLDCRDPYRGWYRWRSPPTKIERPIMMLTSLFAVGVILTLMLSYFRTFMGVEFATLEQTGDRLAARISKSNGHALQGRPAHLTNMKSIDPEVLDAIAHTSFSHILESDFMAAIANAHDQLREDVSALQMQLNQGDAPQSDLAQLRAELTSLQRRTERQLRLDSGAIAHLTAQLDELASQSSSTAKSPAKRRASGPKSA